MKTQFLYYFQFSKQENLSEITPETSAINDKSATEPKKENPKKDAELKTKLKKEK